MDNFSALALRTGLLGGGKNCDAMPQVQSTTTNIFRISSRCWLNRHSDRTDDLLQILTKEHHNKTDTTCCALVKDGNATYINALLYVLAKVRPLRVLLSQHQELQLSLIHI